MAELTVRSRKTPLHFWLLKKILNKDGQALLFLFLEFNFNIRVNTLCFSSHLCSLLWILDK